jgi:hypothetical protein
MTDVRQVPRVPLRLTEVTGRTGVPGRTIRGWISAGELPAIRGNGCWWVDPYDVLEVRDRRRAAKRSKDSAPAVGSEEAIEQAYLKLARRLADTPET